LSDKLPQIKDDGFFTPEVGAWAEEKYKLIGNYTSMFATAMKNSWDIRIYIDLFAGAGFARIKNTNKVVPSSPFLALSIPDQFDKYIFCDKDKKCLTALKNRVELKYPNTDVSFIEGDSNKTTKEIIANMPSYKNGETVLSFCLVDIYGMNNLAFSTIEDLAEFFMDFLILIPTGMDINRFEDQYYDKTDNTVAIFTGNPNWRNAWLVAKRNGEKFGDFVENLFFERMLLKGFKKPEFKQIKNSKNRVIYHLVFFSKHDRGKSLFKESKKYSSKQEKLF